MECFRIILTSALHEKGTPYATCTLFDKQELALGMPVSLLVTTACGEKHSLGRTLKLGGLTDRVQLSSAFARESAGYVRVRPLVSISVCKPVLAEFCWCFLHLFLSVLDMFAIKAIGGKSSAALIGSHGCRRLSKSTIVAVVDTAPFVAS